MIYWRSMYPIVMLSGLGLAYWALRMRSQASTLDSEQRTAIGLAAFIGAMIGSKIPFWLTQPDSELAFMWLADGKTILGGILGGYISVECAKWVLKIKERTGDQFAVPVSIAVATGRLGCFVAGCCYGVRTDLPWAVVFPLAGNEYRHPTQIYEFLFHASSCGILILCERYRLFPGRRLTVYLLAYMLYRFCTEWIRPEPVMLVGLTAYQLACVVIAALLLLNEWFHRSETEEKPNAAGTHIAQE